MFCLGHINTCSVCGVLYPNAQPTVICPTKPSLQPTTQAHHQPRPPSSLTILTHHPHSPFFIHHPNLAALAVWLPPCSGCGCYWCICPVICAALFHLQGLSVVIKTNRQDNPCTPTLWSLFLSLFRASVF